MTVPMLREADFQRQVTELAALLGWSHVHHRPAQTARGWRTPVSGPLGAGWPDLVLVHPIRRRVLFVELKSDTGRVTADQAAVLALLAEAGAETRVWRPRDFDQLAADLARGETR